MKGHLVSSAIPIFAQYVHVAGLLSPGVHRGRHHYLTATRAEKVIITSINSLLWARWRFIINFRLEFGHISLTDLSQTLSLAKLQKKKSFFVGKNKMLERDDRVRIGNN